MKTHAIIPIFIPHAGCPHDCVFCNQKAITARTAPPTPDEAIETIERNLSTIKNNPHINTVEIAFFGGSFTGIPVDEQTRYLEIAKSYKDRGLIHQIHLSTRPDYIDKEILDNLKSYGADVIELGVQSFDPEVLKRSNRGHDADTVYKSSQMIKDWGFTLGIQLMIGLPGDSHEKCMFSVDETVKIGPDIARIYPTVVIKDTALEKMCHMGTYTPLTEKDAIHTAKEMYKTLTAAGINVIRVGLKSTDIIRSEDGAVGAGSYHPAFRQLVEAEIAKESLESQLAAMPYPLSYPPAKMYVTFYSHPESFSNMIGNRRSNKIYFTEKYPHLSIKFAADQNLTPGTYIAKHIKTEITENKKTQ